jgi:thiol-disulfide isomerase/thioredoxin
MRGKPVLLFLFAEWCGDCKAQAASLTRVWEQYRGARYQSPRSHPSVRVECDPAANERVARSEAQIAAFVDD